MTVKFFTRGAWRDGSLTARMVAESLPAELKEKNNKGQRIEYECNEDLALAMLRAGAPLEFTVWSEQVLEYRRYN